MKLGKIKFNFFNKPKEEPIEEEKEPIIQTKKVYASTNISELALQIKDTCEQVGTFDSLKKLKEQDINSMCENIAKVLSGKELNMEIIGDCLMDVLREKDIFLNYSEVSTFSKCFINTYVLKI